MVESFLRVVIAGSASGKPDPPACCNSRDTRLHCARWRSAQIAGGWFQPAWIERYSFGLRPVASWRAFTRIIWIAPSRQPLAAMAALLRRVVIKWWRFGI